MASQANLVPHFRYACEDTESPSRRAGAHTLTQQLVEPRELTIRLEPFPIGRIGQNEPRSCRFRERPIGQVRAFNMDTIRQPGALNIVPGGPDNRSVAIAAPKTGFG